MEDFDMDDMIIYSIDDIPLGGTMWVDATEIYIDTNRKTYVPTNIKCVKKPTPPFLVLCIYTSDGYYLDVSAVKDMIKWTTKHDDDIINDVPFKDIPKIEIVKVIGNSELKIETIPVFKNGTVSKVDVNLYEGAPISSKDIISNLFNELKIKQ